MTNLLERSVAAGVGVAFLGILAVLDAACDSDSSDSPGTTGTTDSGSVDAQDDRNEKEKDATGDGLVDSGPGKKRVFVTSATYSGDLKGPTGADALCVGASAKAGLGGSWKAWISDTTVNAIDRLNDVGPWYLVDRTTLVFANKAAIVALPSHAIDVDETGTKVSSDASVSPLLVWTGTDETGKRSTRTINANVCLGWADNSLSQSGEVGILNKTDRDWTSGYLEKCDTTHRLYCFEQ